MNLGIITFHCAPSYGAFYQTYALATYLKKLGHNVQVIDYMPSHRQESFKTRMRISTRRFGINKTNFQSLKKIILWYYNHKKKKSFRKAVTTYLPLSKTTYTSHAQLNKDSLALDACFFGSDQIWNYDKTKGEYDGAYFGDFGPEKMLRISYAASFGRTEVPKQQDQLRYYLELLDYIYVREQSAIPIIAQVVNRNAYQVVDPTLLLDAKDYPKTPTKRSRNYILIYVLDLSPTIKKILKFYKKHTNLDIVLLNKNQVTPLKFLELLRGASHVITNSFHGLALSLVHNIEFTSVAREGKASERNVRIMDLLDKVNLMDRLVTKDNLNSFLSNSYSSINWVKVNQILNQLKEESKQKIEIALSQKSV